MYAVFVLTSRTESSLADHHDFNGEYYRKSAEVQITRFFLVNKKKRRANQCLIAVNRNHIVALAFIHE